MGQNSRFKITETSLVARPWTRLPGVTHAFSTRNISRDDFFRQAARGLRIVLLKQIHSDRIHAVDRYPVRSASGDGASGDTAGKRRQRQGDALITATPGTALVIKTADCLPILLFDPEARAAGAVHAGWRGTAARIAEKTVGAMRAHYRAEPSRIRAAIGPGIQACCYEVGEEVLHAFRSQFSYAEDLFRGSQAENPADILLPRQVMADRQGLMRTLAASHAHLDLELANRRQLLAAGLKAEHIVTGAPCTACRNDLLYSYRREREAAGRQYALVGLL